MANIDGTIGNDNLVGTNYDDSMYGDLGNDTMSGGVGRDYLDGDEGNDSMLGGSGDDTLAGSGGNDTLIGGEGADDIRGEAGIDTAVFSESAYGLSIFLDAANVYDPEAGFTYNAELDITVDDLYSIENVIATPFDDAVIVSVEPNTIDGGAGEDSVFYLYAGLYVNRTTNAVPGFSITWQTDGSIRVQNRVSGFETDVDLLRNVEGVGDSLGNDSIRGNASDNQIAIYGGIDTIDGGGGNDSVYFYPDSQIPVEVNLAEGWADIGRDGSRDTAISSVENVYAPGPFNILIGNAGNNSLFGGYGEDTLDGSGGSDTLAGTTGDDTYRVSTGDTITETEGEGTDLVISDVSWTLGAYLENLSLTGGAASGVGNALSNRVAGNAVANDLQGAGGQDTLSGGDGNDTLSGDAGNDTLEGNAGADLLRGGVGDDVYIADGLDGVEEAAGAGTDTVVSSASFTLGANVENLILGNAFASSGSGNALANQITGGSGDNTLAGGDGNDTLAGDTGNDALNGGTGADFLLGGPGNDTYTADGLDNIEEYASQGVDTVSSIDSFTLQAHLEHLVLLGTARRGTGNSGANSIIGNAVDNTLEGGEGADTLTGNAGNDLLEGGAGIDLLRGGAGDDRYALDAQDIVEETEGEGVDTVSTAASHSLAANVENLVLTGTGSVQGTGNALANRLTGNVADNRLEGGAGNDTLNGGAGNDAALYAGSFSEYAFGRTAAGQLTVRDTTPGSGDDGTDTFSEIESILFTDSTATISAAAIVALSGDAASNEFRWTGNSAILLAGNGGADSLTGGAGHDTVEGGDGDDTLSGGAGDDVLRGGVGADSVTYAKAIGSFQLDTSADGILSVRDVSGGGTDWLEGVEVIRFSDAVVTLSSGTQNLTGSDEIRVNSDTSNAEWLPAVAVLGDGGHVVVWEWSNGNTDQEGVYLQRYGAQGEAVGAPVRVNTQISVTPCSCFDFYNPAVAALEDGGYVVAWQSDGTDGDRWGIYVQRFDAAGNRVGGQTQVNLNTSSYQAIPVVTGLSDGGFVVAWMDWYQDGWWTGIFARKYDVNGNPVTGEILVNTETALEQGSPSITSFADGGFVVVWQSQDQDGSGYGVYAQRFDATGGHQGPEFRVNSRVEGSQYAPSVAVLGDGGFVVIWMQGGAPDGSDGIYLQRYSADGSTAGVETRISDQVQPPVVASLADGGFLVTWNGYGIDGSGYGVYARRYGADGAAVDEVFQVSISTTNDQMLPAAAGFPDGSFVVTWFGHGPGDEMSGDVVSSGVNLFEGYDGALGGGVFMRRFGAEQAAAQASIVGNESDNRISWPGSSAAVLGNGGNDTLRGGEGADSIDGGAGDDVVSGAAGNDLLSGGTGADTMTGGGGDDTYLVENLLDAVSEAVSPGSLADAGGTDTVRSFVTFTLVRGVENLVLEGSRAINATGNTAANVLTGNAAANVLDGGAGADTMRGGAGDDTYRVAALGDMVAETPGEGIDTVRATISYTLGIGVENLALEGLAVIDGTGNDEANALRGNAASNVLDGAAGADTLRGGAGNDIYVVDAPGDVVIEFAGEGVDTVRSSLSRNLSANVERLILTGSADIEGAGNAEANTIIGNAGNNVLSGGADNDTLIGGLGNDTLLGGGGNDSYTVAPGDRVVEFADGGIDTLSSSTTRTLGANVEILLLTGAADVRGTGNALDNLLQGNDGNNRLLGQDGADTLAGGAGNDSLSGGNGADVFLFGSVLNAVSNLDTISGFVAGEDKIHLDGRVFDGLLAGTTFTEAQFLSGAGATAALTPDHRIVYDLSTGALYYDADGVGGLDAVQFAIVGTTTHPALAATDFLIVG